MGKTIRTRETIYLDSEKFELLVKLAGETRIPRAVLAREAVDLLLEKYGKLKTAKRAARK